MPSSQSVAALEAGLLETTSTSAAVSPGVMKKALDIASRAVGAVVPASASIDFAIGMSKLPVVMKPSDWVLPGFMNSATALPFLLSVLQLAGTKFQRAKLPERAQLQLQLWVMAVSDVLMITAVVLMGLQAIAAIKADRSKASLLEIDELAASAIGGFFLFVVIGVLHSLGRAIDLIKADKPAVLLLAAVLGCLASGVFTAKNLMARNLALANGDEQLGEALTWFVATASQFVLVTANGAARNAVKLMQGAEVRAEEVAEETAASNGVTSVVGVESAKPKSSLVQAGLVGQSLRSLGSTDDVTRTNTAATVKEPPELDQTNHGREAVM